MEETHGWVLSVYGFVQYLDNSLATTKGICRARNMLERPLTFVFGKSSTCAPKSKPARVDGVSKTDPTSPGPTISKTSCGKMSTKLCSVAWCHVPSLLILRGVTLARQTCLYMEVSQRQTKGKCASAMERERSGRLLHFTWQQLSLGTSCYPLRPGASSHHL